MRSRAQFALALTMLIVTFASGCSSGGTGDLSRAVFEQNLVETFKVTGDEAACISGYTFEEYTDDEIRRLDSEGLTGLGPERWSGYAQALLACSLTDDLDGLEGTDGGG